MKIRCTDCEKKISIDDAFAGGVCRCPYCTALNFVPDEGAPTEEGARPESPTQRPTTPEELQAVAETRGQKHIPVANRVKLQGIVTLVLLGVLVLMIGAGVVLFVTGMRNGNGRNGPAPNGPPRPGGWGPTVDPFQAAQGVKGSWVAGNVTMQSPIIYVVDGGDSMKEAFNFAEAIVRTSILSLGGTDEFNIVLVKDISEKDMFLGEQYRSGPNERAAKKMMGHFGCRGATNLSRALKAALAKKPKTIVLFTAKMPDPQDDPVVETAKKAKEQGVKIVAVALGDRPGVEETMKEVAKASDAQMRRYFLEDLGKYPPPRLD